MRSRNGAKQRELSLYTEVDSELYAELIEFAEQPILQINVWDESLSDELANQVTEPDDMVLFDMDVYLADGVFFELYGTLCYTDLDADPLQGLDVVNQLMARLIGEGVELDDVALDEEDALVLVLGLEQKPSLYLVVGGWLLEEWNELPDD